MSGLKLASITRYARSGESHVAYQTVGTGQPDVVFVPAFWSHVEAHWEQPLVARFLHRLASFGRLIIFDKRGSGLSDPVPLSRPPTLEEWMDDVRTVMDAAGSQRAVLMAHSGGCHMSMLFAATHPDRVSHLILLEAYPRLLSAPDYPCGVPEDWLDALAQMVRDTWGTGAMLPASAPSLAGDASVLEWFGRYERLSASPGAALATLRATGHVDVRAVLPSIQAPTLLLARAENAVVPVDHARYLVRHIPNAELVELPGFDHAFFAGDTDRILDEAERFVTGRVSSTPIDRVLTTILFLDIVDSTRRAGTLGDERWERTLAAHDRAVEMLLARHSGKMVKSTGDGVVARFDGPARAIQCAIGLRDALRALGLEVRIGLHTGEVVLRGDDVAGIAVHIAARVQEEAAPGEVYVSRTVKDLVLGSGIAFTECGRRALKGFPEPFELFAACV